MSYAEPLKDTLDSAQPIARWPERSPEAIYMHLYRARGHAQTQARMKLGIHLPIAEIRRHEDVVRRRAGRFLGSDGPAEQKILYEIPGELRPFYAVFDKSIDGIVTYLRGPHEWLGKHVRRRKTR